MAYLTFKLSLEGEGGIHPVDSLESIISFLLKEKNIYMHVYI